MKNSLFFVEDATLSFSSLDLGLPTAPVAPLVSCSLSQSNLKLSDSSLASFTTSGPDALFGSKNARTVAVTRCSFKNITMASPTQTMSTYAPQQHTSSTSNVFESSDDVYQGNILTGLHAGTFRAFNNTHNDERNIHRERTVATEAFCSFASEDYVFCLAEGQNGGAIAVSTVSFMNIDDCTFTSCRAIGSTLGVGGAIACYGYGPNSISLANSRFYNCSSVLFGGAVALEGGGSITNCTFNQCFCQFGGALFLNISAASDLTVDGILVDDCRTTDTGRGGAIYVWAADASLLPLSVAFSNSKFKKCLATVNGGAFYFSAFQRTTMSFNLNITFTNLKFEENTLDTDSKSGCATDLAAEVGWWGIITEDSFVDCTSKSDHNHIVIRTMDGTQEYEYHNDWMDDDTPFPWYWIVLIVLGGVLIICGIVCIVFCAIRRIACFAPKPAEQDTQECVALRGDTTVGDNGSVGGTSMMTVPPEKQY